MTRRVESEKPHMSHVRSWPGSNPSSPFSSGVVGCRPRVTEKGVGRGGGERRFIRERKEGKGRGEGGSFKKKEDKGSKRRFILKKGRQR